MPIRKCREEDIESVIKIKIETWQEAYQGIIDDEYLANMRQAPLEERLREHFSENRRIVYEEKGEIRGFCVYGERQEIEEGYETYDGEICAIYVKKRYFRNRIGEAMLQYAKEDMKKQGKTSFLLWCLKENIPAREFYQKMGGIEIGEKDIFLNGDIYEEIGYGYKI